MDHHKKSISIALIRKLGIEGWRWLAKWDERNHYFDFITSECLEGESAREAISREVAWELDVNRGRDILICNMAQSNLNLFEVLPGDHHETALKVAFYNVELYRKQAVQKVNENGELAWLTSQEICDGQTHDKIAMNPKLTYLIQRSQVIQHWESST